MVVRMKSSTSRAEEPPSLGAAYGPKLRILALVFYESTHFW